MARADPILVFDLDGTILEVNSFPRWAFTMLACNVAGIPPLQRLRLSLAVQRLLVVRPLGRSGRDGLLAALQAAWQRGCGDAADTAAEHFASRLIRRVRPGLRPVLERVARGEADAILATASAEDYALAVGQALGFRHILATPRRRTDGEGWNRGTRKRDRVLDYVAALGWSGRRIVFFTDHIDDLPLIQASDAVCWFGRSINLRDVRARAASVPIVQYDPEEAAAMLLNCGFGHRRVFAHPVQSASARPSVAR